MRNTVWLVVSATVTACSIDHVMVAALDPASAGATSVSAGSSAAGGAGVAGSGASAGSGGAFAGAGGLLGEGGAGRVLIASGGAVDPIIIGDLVGDAGASSLTACSCLGRSTELCGTDGITYPSGCSDAGPCAPPAIACWHACPCLDGGADSMAAGASTIWFALECVPTAHCSDGVICMGFSAAQVGQVQTTCSAFN